MRHLVRYALLIAFASAAATATAQPTDLTGRRIFINPGHGGNDANDRYIPQTGFWESEGNLVKGLFLRTLLLNLNATVAMSRTLNRTEDDLALSAISEMANQFNADFFLSIHSNGFDGTQNRPLMLFRGYDNQPVFPQSKAMAEIMWQKVFENGNCWTNNNPYVKGDWTFYPDWGTQGLGVLRGLTMPGVLSEGSFHDYIPESWRLRNTAFLHHESRALLRSFIQYYNATSPSHGIIAGIIRDPERSPSWYFKPDTRDQYLPLNGATVSITPGGRTVTIDNLNNGFFVFDSLPPGEYSIIASGVAGFFNDTTNITVQANRSSLAELFMAFDTTRAPALLSVTPSMSDSLYLNQEISLSFDLAMDRDSVEKYLTIVPATSLVYTWNTASTLLKIKPAVQYLPGTLYTLTIEPQACSKWKVPTGITHEYDFVTTNRTSLKLRSSYPKQGGGEVTLYPRINLNFDAPLNPNLLGVCVQLSDSRGNIIARTREENGEKDGRGYYRFEPSVPLQLGSTYHITLKANLADVAGVQLGADSVITFTTRELMYPFGGVKENFDDITRFWDPETSGSTIGTDNPLTAFTFSTTLKRSGTGSGRLDYVFVNSSGGVCRVFNTAKPVIGSNPSQLFFGVWVFGDLSHNTLEYWFYTQSSTNHIVFADTINWAGWDLRSVPFSAIGGTGDINFHSVVIRQMPGGEKAGTVWFDDAAIHTPVGIDDITGFGDGWHLAVNPNPVGETSVIRFEIPETSDTGIEIISLTGKRIFSHTMNAADPGSHTIEFIPAGNIPGGIYLCRLTARSRGGQIRRVIAVKMLIIK